MTRTFSTRHAQNMHSLVSKSRSDATFELNRRIVRTNRIKRRRSEKFDTGCEAKVEESVMDREMKGLTEPFSGCSGPS
jgi:hypothetical protein